jgi:hypothetical protein
MLFLLYYYTRTVVIICRQHQSRMDGEHDSLQLVENQIRSDRWDHDVQNQDLKIALEFYMRQIAQY